MAEGFEPYHVPQQSRRDKLRVVAQNHHHHHPGSGEPATTSLQACTGLFPLYDPSLQLTSDLLCCAPHNFHHNHHQGSVVKEEGANLMMGYVGGGLVSPPSSSSASQQQHPYLDLQSSLHMNPSSIHDLTNNFPYIPHHLREFDHEFNGGGGGTGTVTVTGGDEVVVYKPEPLSLTHDQSNATVGGQGLSLSLSSHPHPPHIHTHHQPNLPLELNLQRCYETCTTVVPTIVGATGSTSNDVSRRPVPLGPFTGYASILKGSRFLRPAQQLLEEFCDLGRGTYAEKISAEASLMDPNCMESFSNNDDSLCCGDGGDIRGKKSRLISLLDEVFRKYKQYYQQMDAVVASFESVAGLSNAAPYANLAIKVMSKHFRCLKNAITEQLQCTNKVHGHMSQGKDEAPNGISDRGFYGQRPPIQNSGFNEHQPIWRPQRGLPERAVTVLRAWLFEHFLHPYPTDTDKLMLAKQTGLSRNQVSNWFINARVRLWKPMVEEIHMLETRQTQKTSPRDERNDNRSTDPLHLANSLASENPSTSTQRFQDTPSKRTRNELLHIPVGSEEPMNVAYSNFSSHPNVGVGMNTAAGGSGVSLTLGLHQNNGMGLSEPFSINAAQRFGLGVDTNSDGYVMAGLEAPNRHFGRDVMGGQLLHDFVG